MPQIVMHSATLLLYRNITRKPPVESLTVKRGAQLCTSWRLACRQSVCIYKSDGSCLETFANLSESDRSQSKLEHNCLETGSLPPGDLCNGSAIKVVIHRGCGYCALKVLVTRCIQSNHQVTTNFP